jgi:hypothetical protein
VADGPGFAPAGDDDGVDQIMFDEVLGLKDAVVLDAEIVVVFGFSQGKQTVAALIPCRSPLKRTASLPAIDVGPVDFWAFALLAAS